jgi:hypothetical protein
MASGARRSLERQNRSVLMAERVEVDYEELAADMRPAEGIRRTVVRGMRG